MRAGEKLSSRSLLLGTDDPSVVNHSHVRTLTSVLGNSQRLDGGAMFGNAPKGMWEKWIPPDEHEPDPARLPLPARARRRADAPARGRHRRVLRARAARALRRRRGPPRAARVARRGRRRARSTSTSSCCRTCTSITRAACSRAFGGRAADARVPAARRTWSAPRRGSARSRRTRAIARRSSRA